MSQLILSRGTTIFKYHTHIQSGLINVCNKLFKDYIVSGNRHNVAVPSLQIGGLTSGIRQY